MGDIRSGIMGLALGLVAFASCGQPTGTGLPCERTFFVDADGDGHGDAASPITACLAPHGYTVPSDDCDDGDATIHPRADELCNDLDDDCDGLVDSLDPSLVEGAVFYADADGDGFGDSTSGLHACETPVDRVFHASDCDDTNPVAYPYADEVCDLVDNDCDGLVDLDDDSIVDAQTYYADADDDGFGDHEKSVVECFAPAAYYVSVPGDCDDFDDSVGESPDYYVDMDGDGYGAGDALQTCTPTPYLVLVDGDCSALESDVNPEAPEVLDDVDNDCDGVVDEDSAS